MNRMYFFWKLDEVGCHFLLQCIKVKSESEVAQSCPTLSDPMVWNLPGSSVHGLSRQSTGVGCHCFLRIRERKCFKTQRRAPGPSPTACIALIKWTFVGKVMSLLFNMLSRLVITFLPKSKRLLISWLLSPSAVILEPRKIKSDTVSTGSPSISHEVMGPDAMIFVFWMLSFKPTFSLSSFTFLKRLFSSSSLSAIGWCHLHIWGYWYFSQKSWFQLVLLPAQRFSWCTLHIS